MIEKRLETFKTELEDPGIDVLQIVRSRIGHGTPYVFSDSEEKYFALKAEVSIHFAVHPDSVKVIGSAHLGFSIAPKKLWNPFGDESDIDVVIIDQDCFVRYWKTLGRATPTVAARSQSEASKRDRFLEYHFRGWIRPDLLEPESAKQWFDFFGSLRSKYDGRKISGALWYDQYFFESYHATNLQELRAGAR